MRIRDIKNGILFVPLVEGHSAIMQKHNDELYVLYEVKLPGNFTFSTVECWPGTSKLKIETKVEFHYRKIKWSGVKFTCTPETEVQLMSAEAFNWPSLPRMSFFD